MRSFLVITGVTLAALAGTVAWWWTHPPDPATVFRARYGSLASVVREPAEGAPGLELWKMVDDRGRTHVAMWRPGPTDAPGVWTVVLIGGIGTGLGIVGLIPESLPVHVLAVEWPWEGPVQMSWLQFVREIPRIRESLLRSPGGLALGVEAARRERPDGPVALMGVSLGVPPAVAALRLARPDALLLADGIADFAVQLEREARHLAPRPFSSPPLSGALAALGARLLEPLDPIRHGAAASGVPVLLIEATGDTRIVRACRERLRATFPHATVRSHDRDHVLGRGRQGVAAIVSDAHQWLGTVDAP